MPNRFRSCLLYKYIHIYYDIRHEAKRFVCGPRVFHTSGQTETQTETQPVLYALIIWQYLYAFVWVTHEKKFDIIYKYTLQRKRCNLTILKVYIYSFFFFSVRTVSFVGDLRVFLAFSLVNTTQTGYNASQRLPDIYTFWRPAAIIIRIIRRYFYQMWNYNNSFDKHFQKLLTAVCVCLLEHMKLFRRTFVAFIFFSPPVQKLILKLRNNIYDNEITVMSSDHAT